MATLDDQIWQRLAEKLDPPAWEPENRPQLEPHQVPPKGKWDLWLLEAGRGAGKTEACSRYFAAYMRAHPGTRGRIIAPTFGDAVEACITGPSGLKAIDPEVTWHPSEGGGSKVRWPNGSEALVLGTPTPRDVDRLRAGGNRHIDWWEELAANPMIRGVQKIGDSWENNAWDQAQMGLRLGEHPHAIASTTPRMSQKYKSIRELKGAVLSKATIDDNPHTNPEWRDSMKALYGGTRLGKQELVGELLEDVEGALWKQTMLQHVAEVPEMRRVVVGVDPSGSSTGADCGIVVAGISHQGQFYVLADYSLQGSPSQWAHAVVDAYETYEADRVVVERNFGGDMVKHTLSTVAPNLPVKEVNASRGKQVRAEPIVGLYEQERVMHSGEFAKLEDQMITWVPGEGPSPDRVDALVWAVTALFRKKTQATMSSPANYRLP